MLLLAVVSISVTVFVFILALTGSDAAIRTRLVQTMRGTSPDQRKEEQPSLSKRLIAPLTQGLLQGAKRVMPVSMLAGIERRLIIAGEPTTLNGFIVMQVLVTGAFIGLPIVVILATGISRGPMALFLLGVFAVVGLVLPRFWLQQRVGQRQSQIIKSLPDAFDLITTCVEAGLGLDAALARVAEKVEGPFAFELSRTLREIGLGRPRKDALRELGDRTGVPDLVQFVNAVIQAEQMGSSVGRVLRVQSDQLRVRRRQRAEEQAYKAPVKMIFPLVLCIFPALFIVILGPAVITIVQDFPTK